LACYNEALEIERETLPKCHPLILATLQNIAQIHRDCGSFDDALGKYKELYSLQLETFGPNSLDIAKTLTLMGHMHYQKKEYTSSIELYQQALQIQRDFFGSDDSLEIASTLNSIGLVLFQEGILDLAKACFTDSLRTRLKVLGPNHRDVAILWYDIATIYLETGNDELALKLYRETLRVEKFALGEKHRDVILTIQHLGLVHQQRGDLDEAEKYFSEALEIERHNGGNESAAVIKLLNLLGNIYMQRANVDKMMKCYIEATRLIQANGNETDILVIAGFNFYGLSRTHPPAAGSA
jgi:tetratricopeptide (TPR) repeat protein